MTLLFFRNCRFTYAIVLTCATFVSYAGPQVEALAQSLQVQQVETRRSKKQPNILFIITDQQHADMMSCTGNSYLQTPALDSLARDEVDPNFWTGQ